MKQLLGCLTCVIVALSGSISTQAAGKFYAVIGAGATLFPDPEVTDSTLPGVTGEIGTETGFNIHGAIGYRISDAFRAEAEFTYRQNDIDQLTIAAFGLSASGAASGDVTSASGMINGYWDIPVSGMIKPYLGAGLGVSRVDAELTVAGVTGEGDDTVFAYQLMGGVQYDISSNAAVRVGYRFFATADPEFGTTESEYTTHNIDAGVVFKF
jgi:opacity protein-like surface antigen